MVVISRFDLYVKSLCTRAQAALQSKKEKGFVRNSPRAHFVVLVRCPWEQEARLFPHSL